MSKYDTREIPWEVHYLLKRSQNLTHFYLQIKRPYESYILRKCVLMRNVFTYQMLYAIPLQAWTGLDGSRRMRLLDFKTIDT